MMGEGGKGDASSLTRPWQGDKELLLFLFTIFHLFLVPVKARHLKKLRFGGELCGVGRWGRQGGKGATNEMAQSTTNNQLRKHVDFLQ